MDGRDTKRAVVDLWSSKPSGMPAEDTAADAVQAGVLAAREYAPWLADALAVETTGGERVLDVGCGPGTLLVSLAEAGADATGIDLVPGHVARAQASLAALDLPGRVEVADAEELPFPDQSFDRVVSNNALQFTPNLDSALREIYRVLRPGGSVRLVLYHRHSAYFWWRFVLRHGLLGGELRRLGSMDRVVAAHIPWGEDDTQLVAHAFTQRELRRALSEAGLTASQTFARGFSWVHLAPAGLLAQKLRPLRSPALMRVLGARLGWYVVGVAQRPG